MSSQYDYSHSTNELYKMTRLQIEEKVRPQVISFPEEISEKMMPLKRASARYDQNADFVSSQFQALANLKPRRLLTHKIRKEES